MFKLFLDFETYYDDNYSLRKMTPVEYIMDPRFEALGCGFSLDDGRKWWVDGPQLPQFFAKIPWGECFMVSHNALFDALIVSMRYGHVPALYGDTLSMARNWISYSTGSVSLAACAKYFGLPEKMDTVVRTKGVNYNSMIQMPALYAEVKEYAVDDVEKCRLIYNKIMASGFPVGEIDIIDMVIRMAAVPKFTMDKQVLHDHMANIERDKQALLERIGATDKANLMSDVKFAAMLLIAGINDVPMKVSKTTGKEQYAFAKTDKAFTELLEHPDPYIQALVAARLGHKSTIEETRTQRFINISNCSPVFPIPLKYSGAHTHRFSGDWSLNAQNLPRGGRLRYSMTAPKGTLVVSVDASQIEARFNSELSGQDDLSQEFANGVDVYSSFAEVIYNRKINKADNPVERFVGKTGILSLGYGSSWQVFQAMCRNQSNPPVILSDQEALSVVMAYRAKYDKIVANWDHADKVILPMIATQGLGDETLGTWGPMLIKRNSIVLPNGNRLRYRDLRHEYYPKRDKYAWLYNRGNIVTPIYGAKTVENAVQALAFVHIMEVAKRVKKLTDGRYTPAHQVHDELIYIAPENEADALKELVIKEMSRPPLWMPNAPLAAEGNTGVSYGAVK